MRTSLCFTICTHIFHVEHSSMKENVWTNKKAQRGYYFYVDRNSFKNVHQKIAP